MLISTPQTLANTNPRFGSTSYAVPGTVCPLNQRLTMSSFSRAAVSGLVALMAVGVRPTWAVQQDTLPPVNLQLTSTNIPAIMGIF